MEITPVSINELKPWDKNPRINDDAIDAVANSIKSFGFNVPILYDQHMMIVAGHVRWKAAKQLGMKTVPGIQLSLSRPSEKRLPSRTTRRQKLPTGTTISWRIS